MFNPFMKMISKSRPVDFSLDDSNESVREVLDGLFTLKMMRAGWTLVQVMRTDATEEKLSFVISDQLMWNVRQTFKKRPTPYRPPLIKDSLDAVQSLCPS